MLRSNGVWCMDIRASPRKGFHRHKEEENALKMRKCLFVPKPKTYDTFTVLKDNSGSALVRDAVDTQELSENVLNGAKRDSLDHVGTMDNNVVDCQDLVPLIVMEGKKQVALK